MWCRAVPIVTPNAAATSLLVAPPTHRRQAIAARLPTARCRVQSASRPPKALCARCPAWRAMCSCHRLARVPPGASMRSTMPRSHRRRSAQRAVCRWMPASMAISSSAATNRMPPRRIAQVPSDSATARSLPPAMPLQSRLSRWSIHVHTTLSASARLRMRYWFAIQMSVRVRILGAIGMPARSGIGT